MSSQPPIRRKLVIVGDGACGKASEFFAMGEFPKEYEPTIFENYVAEIRLDGKPVQLALWDTAGQEEYEVHIAPCSFSLSISHLRPRQRLRPLSYSKAHVILIAFAIDTPDSLENVTVKWIEEVRQICGPSVPVILVGCKADLRPPNAPTHPVSEEEDLPYVPRSRAEAVATAIGARTYKECSSIKNEGVDDVFEAATRASMLLGSGAHASHGSRDRRWSDAGDDAGKCCVVC
ncbi:hypothetical protein BS47DRAFT_1377911 [Hydnum rufescens UP504]|uniref:Uncharacterized protein n=1 Tax=Hydnum rufescens UP504 TaxID=1448309 RepID=A0A9P6AKJ4_9AGAM|nr:hypothetical protein BS47DRAFT_1377911 [Hydnum rufescens UP504]